MPYFEFWIILSFLINAFPVVFMIFWIFHDEIARYWSDIINVSANSQHELFPAFFFAFGMLIIGLFVDGLRHFVEWIAELADRERLIESIAGLYAGLFLGWFLVAFTGSIVCLFVGLFVGLLIGLFAKELIRTEWNRKLLRVLRVDSTAEKQCAFYPRMFIEDANTLQAKGSFAETLFRQKLERCNIRYFMAEGLLSFAIGCLISGILFQIACGTELFGKTRCYNEIPFAFWFIAIVVPLAVSISFLWCRDKVLFLNYILHQCKFDLFCTERRSYFSFFILWYITNMLLYDQLDGRFRIFGTTWTAIMGGVLIVLSTVFLAFLVFRKSRRALVISLVLSSLLWTASHWR